MGYWRVEYKAGGTGKTNRDSPPSCRGRACPARSGIASGSAGKPAARPGASLKRPACTQNVIPRSPLRGDERINASWPEYERALKAAGVSYERHLYPGYPARLQQRHHPTLRRSGGEAGVAADGGVLQPACEAGVGREAGARGAGGRRGGGSAGRRVGGSEGRRVGGSAKVQKWAGAGRVRPPRIDPGSSRTVIPCARGFASDPSLSARDDIPCEPAPESFGGR